MLQVATCFSLLVYCNLLLTAWPEASVGRFYRDPQLRDHATRLTPRRVGKYLLVAVALMVIGFFLLVNGLAGFRLLERGLNTRHTPPKGEHLVRIANGQVFYLACSGSGPYGSEDITILLDSDIAGTVRRQVAMRI